MKHTEKRTVERYFVTEYECDCCHRAYPACSYDDTSAFGAGFAVLHGVDDCGFATREYTEHACSLDCSLSLVRRHMAPHVDFPCLWASEKNCKQERNPHEDS